LIGRALKGIITQCHYPSYQWTFKYHANKKSLLFSLPFLLQTQKNIFFWWQKKSSIFYYKVASCFFTLPTNQSSLLFFRSFLINFIYFLFKYLHEKFFLSEVCLFDEIFLFLFFWVLLFGLFRSLVSGFLLFLSLDLLEGHFGNIRIFHSISIFWY
jgi:hypothetical protein